MLWSRCRSEIDSVKKIYKYSVPANTLKFARMKDFGEIIECPYGKIRCVFSRGDCEFLGPTGFS
jgi:hypothetical protein